MMLPALVHPRKQNTLSNKIQTERLEKSQEFNGTVHKYMYEKKTKFVLDKQKTKKVKQRYNRKQKSQTKLDLVMLFHELVFDSFIPGAPQMQHIQ